MDITPVLKDVREIRDLIDGGPTEHFELTPLINDMSKIGRDVDDTRLVVDGFSDRFDRLDRAVDNYGVDDDQMQRLIDNAMARVGQTFATQRDEMEAAHGLLLVENTSQRERLSLLELALAMESYPSAPHDSMQARVEMQLRAPSVVTFHALLC